MDLESLNGIAPSMGEIESTWAKRLVTVAPSWLSESPPPREYLLRDKRTGRGAVPATGAALVVAAGGAGKSFASVALAIGVATHNPWLGVLAPERAGRVLMVTAEDPADEVRRRVFHEARARGIVSLPEDAIDVVDIHDVHMPLLTSDSLPTEHAAELVALARRRGPYALTIVDPLARVSGASIDGDNVAACALVTVLESIASAGGGLVVGLHHTSQTARRTGLVDATAIRGATGLGDSARLVIVLTVENIEHDDLALTERLGEIVTVTRAKANHVGRWEPIRLRRGEHGVLMPLDSYDEEILSSASPAVRKATAKESERRTRNEAIDGALRTVLGDQPGIGTRDLRAAMAQRMGSCSVDALTEALFRLGGDVRRESGPGRAVRHYLANGACQ